MQHGDSSAHQVDGRPPRHEALTPENPQLGHSHSEMTKSPGLWEHLWLSDLSDWIGWIGQARAGKCCNMGGWLKYTKNHSTSIQLSIQASHAL